jgi:hypothetical protein
MANKLAENINQIAISDLISSKERIIKDVLDKVFGRDWDETVISKEVSITVHPDGTEELNIYNVTAIKFFPIRTDITIINNSVICTYKQDVKVF